MDKLTVKQVESYIYEHGNDSPHHLDVPIAQQLLDTMRENERLRAFISDIRDHECVGEYGLREEFDEALSNKHPLCDDCGYPPKSLGHKSLCEKTDLFPTKKRLSKCPKCGSEVIGDGC